MSKLSPTAIILIISGIGLALALVFYFSKKKKKKTAKVPENTSTPPPNDAADTRQDMPVNNPPATRMVQTPVGLMRRF